MERCRGRTAGHEGDAAGETAQRQPEITDPERQHIRPGSTFPQLPAQAAYRQHQARPDKQRTGEGGAGVCRQTRYQQHDNGRPEKNDQRALQAGLQTGLKLDAALLQRMGRSRRDDAPADETHEQQQADHAHMQKSARIEADVRRQCRHQFPCECQQGCQQRQQAERENERRGNAVAPLPGGAESRHHMPGEQQGEADAQRSGQQLVRAGNAQQPGGKPQAEQRIEDAGRLGAERVTGDERQGEAEDQFETVAGADQPCRPAGAGKYRPYREWHCEAGQ